MPTPVAPFACVTVACNLCHAHLGHGGEGEAVHHVTRSMDGIKVAPSSPLPVQVLHYGASVCVVDDDDADECASRASSSLALFAVTFTRITVNAGKGFADTDKVLPLSDTVVDFLVISE